MITSPKIETRRVEVIVNQDAGPHSAQGYTSRTRTITVEAASEIQQIFNAVQQALSHVAQAADGQIVSVTVHLRRL